MKIQILVLLLAVLLACGGPVHEGDDAGEAEIEMAEIDDGEDVEEGEELEVPPEGSIPLSEIIASMEIAGHTWITEVEFEDGVWEVEFVVGDEEYELEIDPMTGEALSDEPEKADDD